MKTTPKTLYGDAFAKVEGGPDRRVRGGSIKFCLKFRV